ncbi:hypothetical protein SteCoe_2166 [Stentor coeruleus]|uniref:Uncharacterized protein n=1 Tax=Stentor coeruleus TaxID=5963 RepID=A0A1R2D079_9CILI|nr:hypothetical protein SteCoe_2166 [Stentor coeruleus]
MEVSPFQQRFRNRSQLIGKKGQITLGVHSVSKAEISQNKLHLNSSYYSNSTSFSKYAVQNEPSELDVYSTINKSFSCIKLPKLSTNSKTIIHKDFLGKLNKSFCQNLGYSMKHKVHLKEIPVKNKKLTTIFTRNGSLALKDEL